MKVTLRNVVEMMAHEEPNKHFIITADGCKDHFNISDRWIGNEKRLRKLEHYIIGSVKDNDPDGISKNCSMYWATIIERV